MRRGKLLLISTLLAAALAVLIVFGLSSSGSGPVGRAAPALPKEHIAGPAATLPAVRDDSEVTSSCCVSPAWASAWP